MSDRVRMKSLSVFHNPIIESHAEGARPDPHTVTEGDEFSTSEAHAQDLERAGLAERVSGEAAELSDRAAKIAAFQTSADDQALSTTKVAPDPSNKMAAAPSKK